MKRKRLALLLAAALTVTSVDGTAFAVSGADFSSEPVLDEAEAQPEEAAAEPAEENVEEESFADEASLTDETAEAETETESTEESQELTQPEEELTQEPVETVEPEEAEAEEELPFSAGDDEDFEDEETSSIIPWKLYRNWNWIRAMMWILRKRISGNGFHLLRLRMETIVSVRKILMMEILLYMDMIPKLWEANGTIHFQMMTVAQGVISSLSLRQKKEKPTTSVQDSKAVRQVIFQ